MYPDLFRTGKIDLSGWRVVASHAPELLGLELSSCVLLPDIVESGEENDRLWVGGESTLDGAESSGLVRQRRNSSSVRTTLPLYRS